VLVVSTIPIALHREVRLPAAKRERPGLAAIAESLYRTGMRRWLLVLVTYKSGEWFATGMLRLFLKDAGYSLEEIGAMLGFVGFSAALAGAIAGGALTARLGRRAALVVFGTLQTLAIGSFAIATRVPTVEVLYTVAAAEHFTSAMATAALFTAMMDFSRPTHAGTDYTVQACAVVIATGAASMSSGASAEALGYPVHFIAAAGLSAVGVAIAALYRASDPSFALRARAGR
jgi:predicted MFS family arabinose efflux permease